jgi:DNA primase
VFLLLDKGEYYGAVGRNLSISNNPRWFVYGRYNGATFQVLLSKCGSSNSGLLVEDCVSACVASSYFNSIALLGTNIPDESVKYLIKYDKLYLALDPDATGKAIKLQKKLNYYRPTFIVPLKKDIKYYSSFELETLRKDLDNG